MSREPEALVAQRRQLGAALATFRKAAEQSQAQLGGHTCYDRTSISRGRDRPCCDTQSHVVSEHVKEVRHMSKT
jgi:hypothetical protein